MQAYPHETATIERDIPSWLITHQDCGEVTMWHPKLGKFFILRDKVDMAAKAFRGGMIYAQQAGSGTTYLVSAFEGSRTKPTAFTVSLGNTNTEYTKHFLPTRQKSQPVEWVIK